MNIGCKYLYLLFLVWLPFSIRGDEADRDAALRLQKLKTHIVALDTAALKTERNRLKEIERLFVLVDRSLDILPTIQMVLAERPELVADLGKAADSGAQGVPYEDFVLNSFLTYLEKLARPSEKNAIKFGSVKRVVEQNKQEIKDVLARQKPKSKII